MEMLICPHRLTAAAFFQHVFDCALIGCFTVFSFQFAVFEHALTGYVAVSFSVCRTVFSACYLFTHCECLTGCTGAGFGKGHVLTAIMLPTIHHH